MNTAGVEGFATPYVLNFLFSVDVVASRLSHPNTLPHLPHLPCPRNHFTYSSPLNRPARAFAIHSQRKAHMCSVLVWGMLRYYGMSSAHPLGLYTTTLSIPFSLQSTL